MDMNLNKIECILENLENKVNMMNVGPSIGIKKRPTSTDASTDVFEIFLEEYRQYTRILSKFGQLNKYHFDPKTITGNNIDVNYLNKYVGQRRVKYIAPGKYNIYLFNEVSDTWILTNQNLTSWEVFEIMDRIYN